MKKLLILGGGTAGTMMANHLDGKLPGPWEITVVDQTREHYYQPGFLLLPFGMYEPEELVKDRQKFLPEEVVYVQKKISSILPRNSQVMLADGHLLDYDILVVATGCATYPEEVPGLLGPLWNEKIFDFYTFEGSCKLREALHNFQGGNLVVHINELPIKCPVAPLEFAFLADSFFRERGIRSKVNITYVTPLDGAFTKPRASQALGHLMEQKNIQLVPDFGTLEVDHLNQRLLGYNGEKIPFDLLVTVPTNMGDPCIEHSGLGDDLRFIPTHKDTLQSKKYPNIFALGDATDVPTSKAGSVAHFEAEILTQNILDYAHGEPLSASYDGHANCFIETGEGKAVLIDFNYTQEPVPGDFPLPKIGPLSLLQESRMNHMGKLAFKWIYWNVLLEGHPIPFVHTEMTRSGKQLEPVEH